MYPIHWTKLYTAAQPLKKPLPRSWVCRVWSDEKVIFLVGDEVHPAQVHRLMASIEAYVAFFGLPRMSRRPDDQPLDVIKDALVLRVRIGHDHKKPGMNLADVSALSPTDKLRRQVMKTTPGRPHDSQLQMIFIKKLSMLAEVVPQRPSRPLRPPTYTRRLFCIASK